ncbi:MAG: deoxyhypusine synthase [Ignavibacteriales bacterium]|nr:deoxyhypusine synthase [Ignavibacteriales bacterium]
MKSPQHKNKFLRGKPIERKPIPKNIFVTDLVENYFNAYNAARLKEACLLFTQKMLSANSTVGMSITGALTPAGLGGTCIVPLMKAGFVDWIVSTGANIYHDTHFSIGHEVHSGSPFVDDRILRKHGVIRIYDIVFDEELLYSTDKFFRELVKLPEFQKEMGTAELHFLLGKYVAERERILGIKNMSLLSAAYHYGVPIYTSSPGDSSLGMNVARAAFEGNGTRIDVLLDVNETAAIVLQAKRSGGNSGVFILGGGSPKNFILQTEPQIQEVFGIKEKGHDFFLQITDARPDTGGLSGATPSEAVSWGKVDPDKLPDTVVAYLDSTLALPIMTSYALAKCKPRPLKKLYHQRFELMENLKRASLKVKNK